MILVWLICNCLLNVALRSAVRYGSAPAAFTGIVRKILINPLQYSGHYICHQFNFQQFYVESSQCINVFCVDLRTNSDYFPIQH
jgi:hypothetical protein